MGSCAEVLSNEKNISREKQDEFAIESYKRSLKAIHAGLFKDEIVPVEISQSNGDSIIVDIDEEPKRRKLDGINNLRTAFDKNGTITAVNASSINDGAAALVVMEKEKAEAMGIKPICKIVSHVSVAHEPLYFTTAPSKAILKVLDKSKLSIDDIDLFEINEAFSNVVISAIEELSISIEKVNVHGGAVSLGHPIGASGARILVTLISALIQRKQKFGLATLCIGGGEAAAMIVEIL
jgi:acetyl-CoA C-acetyltransferase